MSAYEQLSLFTSRTDISDRPESGGASQPGDRPDRKRRGKPAPVEEWRDRWNVGDLVEGRNDDGQLYQGTVKAVGVTWLRLLDNTAIYEPVLLVKYPYGATAPQETGPRNSHAERWRLGKIKFYQQIQRRLIEANFRDALTGHNPTREARLHEISRLQELIVELGGGD